MDKIASIPTAISQCVGPTFAAYEPLLLSRSKDIKTTKRETFAYGNHERQKLDVYYPPSNERRPSLTSSNEVVLIFLHGGGLVRGSKTLPMADGLVHANIGHYFSSRHGYTTIIPDYRLMSHGARFPSGGEDLALVVDWIYENLSRQDSYSSIDLYIMGNSAGGIHSATYLYSPDFARSRARVITSDPEAKVKLCGIVLLSVPFNFRASNPERQQTLTAYFGEDIDSVCPQGLLRSLREQSPEDDVFGVRTLVLNGTLDPDDEILRPRTDFVGEWNKSEDGDEDDDEQASRSVLSLAMMEGQNHISPPLSLGTGIEREEAWGFQVADFIDSARR